MKHFEDYTHKQYSLVISFLLLTSNIKTIINEVFAVKTIKVHYTKHLKKLYING